MLKANFGVTEEPFHRKAVTLLAQQQAILDMLKIHAQQGGFSVIVGAPGVGKSVLREQVEALAKERDTVVASFSRTLQSYRSILRQLAESLRLKATDKALEQELINTAFAQVRERKTFFTLIDEAHLLDMTVLRQLRLLFDRFPKKHNLVLFGQPELLYTLSMRIYQDLKSRITYSQTLRPLNDQDLLDFIHHELDAVRLPQAVFDEGAMELIQRAVQGNLRLCRNLCYASLVEACRHNHRSVSISHVNNVLVQPHWRTHEELIKQQHH